MYESGLVTTEMLCTSLGLGHECFRLALKKSVPLVKYVSVSQIPVPLSKHPSRHWEDFPEEVTGQSILESDERGIAPQPTLSFDKDNSGGWGMKVLPPRLLRGGVRVNQASWPPSSQACLCTMCPFPLSQTAFHRENHGTVI